MNPKNEILLEKLVAHIMSKDDKCDEEIVRFCITHIFSKKRKDICPEEVYKLTYGCEHSLYLKKEGKSYGFLIRERLTDKEKYTIKRTVYLICNAPNVSDVVNLWQHNCDISKGIWMEENKINI